MPSVTRLLLYFAAAATPSSAGTIAKRNPCDGGDEPRLYHEYGPDECPPKNSFTDDGHCSFTQHDRRRLRDLGCVKYCEVRTSFFWGQEKPFAGTYCSGPQICRIAAQSRTVSYKPDNSPSPEYSEALAVGISASFSAADATATARASAVELDDGQCGYFAFVPVIHESCGSLTTAPRDYDSGTPTDECSDEVGRWSTRGNYCASQLRRKADGSADGDTIFVRTDCGTHLPLPLEDQDDIYGEPRVALSRHMQEEWAVLWREDGRARVQGGAGMELR